MKKHDWGVKSIVEVSAIHALLEPGNTSFTIYFLSVLIVQFSEAYWNRSTMEVIERVTAQILDIHHEAFFPRLTQTGSLA